MRAMTLEGNRPIDESPLKLSDLPGIHLTQIPLLDYQRHLFFERNLRTVTANTRNDGYTLLNEAASLELDIRTTIYSLEDANRALQDLQADRIQGTGILSMI